MEFCMEAKALKSSVRGELTMHKNQQHVVLDDLLYVNGAVSSEDFSVDCFLDFTNGEFETEEEEEEKQNIVSQEHITDNESNSNSSTTFSFDSVLTSGLSVPDDEIAGLEWVSQFVDDSLLELPFSCPVFKQQSEKHHAKARFESEPEPVFVKTPCFSLLVPSKSRSKRAKPASKTWLVGSMPLSESSSSTTSSSSISSSGFSMTSSPFQNTELANDFTEPTRKKQKRKPGVQLSGNAFQRRCSHCQVQKTPQWRTGPHGAKTLCNACGVRYKSGRLFPEYRPACSPTFSGDVHSNSHRKVLEMRKIKESVGEEPDELTRMVPSFEFRNSTLNQD